MKTVKSLEEMPETIGGVAAEERETIIRKDVLEGVVRICTTDYVEYGRIMKRCRSNPKSWRAVGYETLDGQPQAAYFEASPKCVRYSGGEAKSSMTEEQRAAARERLMAINAAKKAKRDA